MSAVLTYCVLIHLKLRNLNSISRNLFINFYPHAQLTSTTPTQQGILGVTVWLRWYTYLLSQCWRDWAHSRVDIYMHIL